MEKIQFLDFKNCARLTNNEIEIIVSLDFGPRILGYNFVGGKNILGIHAGAQTETTLGEFKPYGGHRLWIAPENMPLSYAPDNLPVEYFFEAQNNSIRLTQPVETVTGTQKEITVTLDKSGSGVQVKHKITNYANAEISLALWALTIMQGGGEVLIPNEPFAPYSAETLLPIRNLTVWSYTDFTDLRWKFEKEFIRLKVDAEKSAPQKIGVLNKQGWAKYRLEDLEFTKHFEYDEAAVYTDLNSNMEVYVAGNFVEIESLAPFRRLKKGESAEHRETWKLAQIKD